MLGHTTPCDKLYLIWLGPVEQEHPSQYTARSLDQLTEALSCTEMMIHLLSHLLKPLGAFVTENYNRGIAANNLLPEQVL